MTPQETSSSVIEGPEKYNRIEPQDKDFKIATRNMFKGLKKA